MKAIKTFCTSRPRYQNETTEKAPNIAVSGASFKVVLLYIIPTSIIYFYIILYTLLSISSFSRKKPSILLKALSFIFIMP